MRAALTLSILLSCAAMTMMTLTQAAANPADLRGAAAQPRMAEASERPGVTAPPRGRKAQARSDR